MEAMRSLPRTNKGIVVQTHMPIYVFWHKTTPYHVGSCKVQPRRSVVQVDVVQANVVKQDHNDVGSLLRRDSDRNNILLRLVQIIQWRHSTSCRPNLATASKIHFVLRKINSLEKGKPFLELSLNVSYGWVVQ